jgi:DNA polymerase elongation subunit (family B)
VLVLKGCSAISGVDIKETEDESKLLEMFEELILSYDPDIIIG